MSRAKPVAPKEIKMMGIHTKSQPMRGKKAASSRMTAPRMNPFNGVMLLCLESLAPRWEAMPAEPMVEMASAAPSRIQPMNLAGPNGRASRMTMGMVTAMTRMSPSQKVPQGVLSTRVWAWAIKAGNNSHHAVSIAGKAVPIMSRMKKMAEMSAMGDVLSVLVDVRDTGMGWGKLQEKQRIMSSE